MVFPKYHEGHVVECHFPFEEDSSLSKPRPGLVVRIDGNNEYLVVKITGTNYSGTQEGFWIKESDDEYLDMNLDKPSFVQIERHVTLHASEFFNDISPTGQCSDDFLDKVIEKMSELGFY